MKKKIVFLYSRFALVAALFMFSAMLLSACGGGGGGGSNGRPPAITSWNVKANVYQLYGSNTFAGISGTTTYWGLSQSDWTYLGEGTATKTFPTTGSYKYFLITWSGTPVFYFDSIHDDINGAYVSPLSAFSENIEDYPITTPSPGATNIWTFDSKYSVTLGEGAFLFQYTNILSGGNGSMTIRVTTTP
jgi:hypothetical protein